MKQKLNITTFLLFWCITALWSIPRPEYPRPQFERMDWVNLNGEWTCSFDFGGTGMEREFYKSNGFDQSKRIGLFAFYSFKASFIACTDSLFPQRRGGNNTLL